LIRHCRTTASNPIDIAGRQENDMLNMMRNKSKWAVLLHGVLAAFLLAGGGAALAANVTVNLWAKAGTASLPDGGTVKVWGYTDTAVGLVTQPGGPTLIVNQGDVVTVNLSNTLTAATAVLFQGQAMVPDSVGAAPNGARVYTFTASNPGTFLYEAGLLPNSQHQAAMGLYGALIVRPAAVPFTGISVTPTPTGAVTRTDTAASYTSGSNLVADTSVLSTDVGAVVSGAGIPFGTTITAVTPGTSFTMSAPAAAAYGASTVFNDEAVLVLSEIDPALNNSASPAAFDMRNYAPKYFLINGKAYPATAPIASAAGNKVLLRYVNAGVKHHSMAVLGLRQNFVAKDASLLPTLTLNVAAETLAPGQTGDAIVTVPAVTTESKFAVYDGNLALHNNGADNAFGGMLTFVAGGTGAAATGPTTSAVALAPNPSNASVSVALSASIKSTSATVTAAEYFIDTTGTAGTGIPMSGTFGAATVSVSSNLSTAQLAALLSGNHTIYVHGKDASNQWGAFSSAVLNLDKAGPISSGLTLTPNPSSGAVSVALSATGNDSTTGNSNIAAAQYSIDGGTPVAMTVNVTAPIASLSATIPAGLPVGPHAVAVRSQDALGNWGAFATITLNVAAGGPVTSAVSAAPNPNNGMLPLSSSQSVVRVTATITSTGSTVSAAEGFIDAVGVTGAGFPFVPTDGLWNGAVETGYADIPLANINALSAGSHTIYVHGKDAVGSWGATSTMILTIDKMAPTISSVTLNPSTVAFGTSSTALAVTAADIGTSVAGGQYWIDGTATPPATATAFNGASVSINTSALVAGVHTIYVRVQDAATNWSAVSSATLTVIRAVNDAYSTLLNTSNNSSNPANNRTQSFTINSGNGVLVNDQPTGVSGRTATPANPVVTKTSGSANGSMTVALNTNGSFTYTLSVPASTGVTGNANIRAAKRGTYQFTYTEALGGATSTATVTITVN
jgi:hypothetical protein